MIGLGRALTIESATSSAIADVRRAWEAAPASSCVEGAPSPVLFASFAFRSPARSVAFVPALTLIDEAGARWVEPVHPLGSKSHLVASLANAEAIGVVAPDVEVVEPGQELAVVPLVG